MSRLFWLVLVLAVATVSFAQGATAQDKAAAQVAFEKIDAGLQSMPWTYGAAYVKPDLENLKSLISAKGVKIVLRNIRVKSSVNHAIVKEWTTEEIYTVEKFQEAIKFQMKFIDQQEAHPEKTPPISKDPKLVELNKRFLAYWSSRGLEGEEPIEPQRKSANEWTWADLNSSSYKTKTPMVSRVRLVQEGGKWKLSEIHVNEVIYQNK